MVRTVTLTRSQLRVLVEDMGWERADVDTFWRMALKEQESPGYHARARIRYWRRLLEQSTGVKTGEVKKFEPRLMGTTYSVLELDGDGKMKGVRGTHQSYELADGEARKLQAEAYNREVIAPPSDD